MVTTSLELDNHCIINYSDELQALAKVKRHKDYLEPKNKINVQLKIKI
jgi:hypothetical protein